MFLSPGENVYALQINRHRKLLFSCHHRDHIRFRSHLQFYTGTKDTSTLFGVAIANDGIIESDEDIVTTESLPAEPDPPVTTKLQSSIW